jgi:hypothetical protein
VLAEAVKKAESKITGSTENLKIFRDMLSKEPEADPDVIEYQGQQIPKTTTMKYRGEEVTQPNKLYEALLAQGEGTGTPITFRDLQGYYSELGEKLSGGNLPADVYLALKGLQEDIGKQMDSLAKARNVGATLSQAKAMYKDYMESFRNATGPNHSGSPIANALDAKDTAYATKPLTAMETAQRVRNMLARFDIPTDPAGGAAKLYDNYLGALREFDKTGEPIKVPAAPKPPKIKPEPEAPEPQQPKVKPVPEPRRPLVAKTTQLTQESLEGVKAQRILDEAEKIKKSKSWLVSSIVAFDIIRSGLMGNWQHVGLDVAARVLYSVGKRGIAEALADPRVVSRLSKLTPEDYAAIGRLSPERRTAFAHSMVPVVQEAERRGIRLSPVIVGMATSALAGREGAMPAELPPNHSLAQTQPQQ